VTSSPSDAAGTGGDDAAGTPQPPDPAALADALGHPLDPALLERALIHRSFAYEAGGIPTNERLEFLGDSVLGLIITDALYRRNPDLPEGQLAKLRAGTVNMRALAGVARELGLGAHLRLGRGEENTGGREKDSILADTLEALLGAVYLDGGIEAAWAVVHRLFDPVMADSAQRGAGLDWKTSLQELAATQGRGTPDYDVTETGPDHAKCFRALARLNGEVHGEGAGRSKKEAEQRAAEAAWTALSELSADASADFATGDGPAPA
jgi:ribonuclease III